MKGYKHNYYFNDTILTTNEEILEHYEDISAGDFIVDILDPMQEWIHNETEKFEVRHLHFLEVLKKFNITMEESIYSDDPRIIGAYKNNSTIQDIINEVILDYRELLNYRGKNHGKENIL